MTQLIDPFNRQVEYLRLSVTDRCDLRCSYCIPEGFKGFEQPPHWLNFDEIERLLQAFARLGLKKIRMTGGEPLLRRNLPELASRIAQINGIEDLSVSSNATQLTKHAVALKDAGVSRLNISLDSLKRERYKAITGRDQLDSVLLGLDAALLAGFTPVKINMVVMKGVNDDEVDDMVQFCSARGFVLRLIEVMPMGETGRNSQYIDLQPIKRQLQEKYALIDGVITGAGPARYMQSSDGNFNIGFITPLSQHFCDTCNRVRLAVDGTLYLCLGQENKYEFRPLLRDNASDEELNDAIIKAIALKPEKHEFKESPNKVVRFMNMTGG